MSTPLKSSFACDVSACRYAAGPPVTITIGHEPQQRADAERDQTTENRPRRAAADAVCDHQISSGSVNRALAHRLARRAPARTRRARSACPDAARPA